MIEMPAPTSESDIWIRCYWRVDHKAGRTIYAIADLGQATDDDRLIGMMDTHQLASDACRHHNNWLDTVHRRS